MPVPSRLEVPFGQYAKSLIDEALAKLPSQFLTSCMLRQLVAVFVGEVQELYDAVLDMQRGRTLYAAEAANLDALRRSWRERARTSTAIRTGLPLTAWGRLGIRRRGVPGRSPGRVHPGGRPGVPDEYFGPHHRQPYAGGLGPGA
ncbi:MAG: hypothetical protein ACLTTU_08560 [Bilophila wadsworthia]